MTVHRWTVLRLPGTSSSPDSPRHPLIDQRSRLDGARLTAMSARSESGFGGQETVTVLALFTVLLLIGIGIADLFGLSRRIALIPPGILVGGVIVLSIVMRVRDRRLLRDRRGEAHHEVEDASTTGDRR